MNNNPTREEVLASIVADSTQLNAEDLITGPRTVTITGVRRGDKEQPIIIDIAGHQPWKPCKTMRRVLIATLSDDPKQWIGKQATLYCDPTVTWAGVRVGGIRISHLSGLDKPKTFLLTQTRGKKAEIIINPITISPEDQVYVDDAIRNMAEATTVDDLKCIGLILKDKSAPIQEALRGPYTTRLEELKQTGSDARREALK